MKNPDEHRNEGYRMGEEENASHNPNPERNENKNWDEKAHMSRNIEKNATQNERKNLQPDQEKRTGNSSKYNK
jgi:hypothetical protein